jgi:hypothetical protein
VSLKSGRINWLRPDPGLAAAECDLGISGADDLAHYCLNILEAFNNESW